MGKSISKLSLSLEAQLIVELRFSSFIFLPFISFVSPNNKLACFQEVGKGKQDELLTFLTARLHFHRGCIECIRQHYLAELTIQEAASMGAPSFKSHSKES